MKALVSRRRLTSLIVVLALTVAVLATTAAAASARTVIRNLQTGRCLTHSFGFVYTARCDIANPTHIWNFTGLNIQNDGSKLCLAWYGGRFVWMARCSGNSNDQTQLWNEYEPHTINPFDTPSVCLDSNFFGSVSAVQCVGRFSQKWIHGF